MKNLRCFKLKGSSPYIFIQLLRNIQGYSIGIQGYSRVLQGSLHESTHFSIAKTQTKSQTIVLSFFSIDASNLYNFSVQVTLKSKCCYCSSTFLREFLSKCFLSMSQLSLGYSGTSLPLY